MFHKNCEISRAHFFYHWKGRGPAGPEKIHWVAVRWQLVAAAAQIRCSLRDRALGCDPLFYKALNTQKHPETHGLVGDDDT